MTPARYRKKPIEIEAVQLSRENMTEVLEWMDGCAISRLLGAKGPEIRAGLEIATLEGAMFALPGDWIIRGVAGEFYPCRDDIFRQTYEEQP